MTTLRGRTVLQRPWATVVVAWVAMLGVDVAFQAGILAPLYDWGSGFFLSPEDAFLRIPAGYAAFAMLTASLAWLLPRLGVRTAAEGARVGAIVGAVVWGSSLLAMWSIATASPELLVGWWIAQVLGTAVAGAMLGAAIAGVRLRRLAAVAGMVVIGGLAIATALQTVGYAAAPVRL